MIFNIHRKLKVLFKIFISKTELVFKGLGYNQRQLNILTLQCRKTSRNETLGFY